MKKKKPGRKKKVPLVRYRLDSQRVQVNGDWCIECVSVCVCLYVVARHRRPKGIRWSKEKKGEKTETDMQSKAIEGVPVVHTRTTRFWSFSLSVSFFVCVGRIFTFFSPSAHVDLIYADYFTITIDHPRVVREKARRKRARVAHIKGQLDRATRTIKEWVKQEHDFSFIIVIMAVDASTDFL